MIDRPKCLVHYYYLRSPRRGSWSSEDADEMQHWATVVSVEVGLFQKSFRDEISHACAGKSSIFDIPSNRLCTLDKFILIPGSGSGRGWTRYHKTRHFRNRQDHARVAARGYNQGSYDVMRGCRDLFLAPQATIPVHQYFCNLSRKVRSAFARSLHQYLLICL